jgi:hypothetical protein
MAVPLSSFDETECCISDEIWVWEEVPDAGRAATVKMGILGDVSEGEGSKSGMACKHCSRFSVKFSFITEEAQTNPEETSCASSAVCLDVIVDGYEGVGSVLGISSGQGVDDVDESKRGSWSGEVSPDETSSSKEIDIDACKTCDWELVGNGRS